MNTEAVENTLVIPVDREHSAMRLAIVLTFIAVWVVGFLIFSVVIPNEGFSLLAVLLGFGVAYGLTALLERYPQDPLAQRARRADRSKRASRC